MAALRKIVYTVNWKLGLAAWSNVYSFPRPISTTPEVIPKDLGEPTLSSRFHRPNDPSQQRGPKLSKSEKRKLRKKQAWERSTGQNVQQQKERKKVEKAEDSNNGGSVDESSSVSSDNKSPMKSGDMSENLSENVQTQLRQAESDPNKTVESDPAEAVESDFSPVSKKQKTTEHDPNKPAFRVTCNRNGGSHPFDSMGAASNFGGAVYNYFHWNVSMKEFDIEVILNIDDRDVTVCLGLTKQSLHHRFIKAFGPTALRATIAFNMLR